MEQHTGYRSPEKSRVTELIVKEKGDFTYIVRRPDTKEVISALSGKLPPDDLKALIKSLEDAGKGGAAEDAGYVSFEFVDSAGKVQSKEYSMPRAAPAKDILATISDLVAKHGKKFDPSSAPASGPATTTSAPAVASLTDAQVDEIARDAAREYPKATVHALRSSNTHLGGDVPIANPIKGVHFRMIYLAPGMAAPKRAYFCVSDSGNVTYPFKADKDFTPLLAGQDLAKLSDDYLLKLAKLYIHLTSLANEDGWVIVEKPDDFMNITFNMPKDEAVVAKRKLDAQKIEPSGFLRTKAGTVGLEFCVWHSIGGRLVKWKFIFSPEFKVTSTQIARWGGGGYD
jgi:hypothetical protein